MGLLKMIGLMTVAEHEAKVHTLEEVLSNMDEDFGTMEAERDRLSDKFKRAATDLAAQAEEIAGMRRVANGLDAELVTMTRERNAWQQTATTYAEELATARPDAQSWRNRQERERQRGERRKGMG